MKCPTCGENTPDAWAPLYVQAPGGGINPQLRSMSDQARFAAVAPMLALDWMYCANTECGELVLRVHKTRREPGAGAPQVTTETWAVHPRGSQRPVDRLVPPAFARDYREASAILDVSPRVSAVLSRRILADLLETYAGHTHFGLADRIKAFVADSAHPASVRENLHYLREMGDFSAHTQKNDQAEIIDVDRVEAEWTLDVIDRLFDYFIVGPERDRKMREAMDKKVKEAGRRPVPPLPDESESGT